MRNGEIYNSKRRICVGVISAPHGVRGLVRMKSFTAKPENIVDYVPLTDVSGVSRIDLSIVGRSKKGLLVCIDGVSDKNGAEALRGMELYANRDAFPEAEDKDEFYYADLVGLPAYLIDGVKYGRVKALHDFGAGDMIEIMLEEGGDIVMPFTKVVVPDINLDEGRILVNPVGMSGRAALGDPQDYEVDK